MPVAVRPDLDKVPHYRAGQRMAGAVNLASNEVSYDPPAAVVAALSQAARAVHRYPQLGSDDVVARLATDLDVDPGHIVVGCGSVSLCQQLAQVMCNPGDEVVFAWRSFDAYPIITQIVGARRVAVPLTVDLRPDLDAMLSAITPAAKLVFVSNPNNPTGTALRRDELERFLSAVPDHVLVVLDEAYWQFVTDPDVCDGLRFARDRDNVAVLRTLSKAYGLAGARIGFCVAPPAVASGLRKVGIPFAVSALAQAAALAALDIADELLARCTEVTKERERVRATLLNAGYRVPESQANFVWLPLGLDTERFNRHCLSRRVLVRAFPPDGVRVTIGLPKENDAFLAAARTFTC